jgi:DNA-binding GntR family transcriptional regulator
LYDDNSEVAAVIDSLKVSANAAPVRHETAHKLRQAIAAGVFAPGQRLVERDLQEKMGVSRTSIREALRQLEADGLVEVVPGKGPIVAVLTPDTARDIYQVRGHLEGLAAALFAEHGSPDQLSELDHAVNLIEAAVAEDDLARALDAKEHFYAVLLEGSGNAVLGSLLGSLHGRIRSLQAVTLSQPGRAAKSVAEVRAIVTAIKAGHPDEAFQASIRHVASARAVAVSALGAAVDEQ